MKNEVVIVNARDKVFIEKIKYSLGKAGFKITEEYREDCIILVFER